MKKRFHRLGLYVVLILLLSSLAAGCAPQAPNPTVPTGESTSDPTKATTPTQATEQIATQPTEAVCTEPTAPPVHDPYPQYVLTDVQETIEGSDQHWNQWKIPIRIPKIVPFSDDAVTCQQEIQNIFTSKVAEIRDYSGQGFHPLTASIGFDTYLNGDILSLVIQEATNIDINLYWVYNFDVKSGKRLDTDALMQKLGIKDYAQRITQTAKDKFEELWPPNPAHDSVLYKQQAEATISQENIDAAQPFLAQDGQLTVAIYIYSLAGASRYTYTLPVA